VLKTTDSLSTNPFAGPSRATPIILNLYQRASIISLAILSAVYSETYAEASTVFCRFKAIPPDRCEPFTNIRMMPVCDLLLRRSCACAALQKKLIYTNLPSASGIPGGRLSSCPAWVLILPIIIGEPLVAPVFVLMIKYNKPGPVMGFQVREYTQHIC
jgi:hypothetical protein